MVRTSGVLLASGTVLLLGFWWLDVVLMPYRQLNDSLAPLALHRHWCLVDGLGVLGTAAMLAALPGIYGVQLEKLGGLGLGVYPDQQLGIVAMPKASGGTGPVHERVLRAADTIAEVFLTD